MTDEPTHDLSDLLVLQMVERNHTPREEWMLTGQLRRVFCDECHHDWPCPTRIALRERTGLSA